MAEDDDEFDVRSSQDLDSPPHQRAREMQQPPLASHHIPVGFIGVPNSGKTSFIHAVRNTSRKRKRDHGNWDFGGVGAKAGGTVESPDSETQAATAVNFFRVADFCDVRRAWVRLGPIRFGRRRTLAMPEVAGEIVERIAKGPDYVASTPIDEQAVAKEYQGFLARSEGILCFISLDGSDAVASTTVAIKPESSLMDQLVQVRRVLESCDEERARIGHARHYAVSVIITKADLLRDRPEIDRVRIPRSRSSVAAIVAARRDQILENELRRQESDDTWVQFSVWDLMRFPRAEGDLDVQEAIAADFLKCHAPRTASEMAAFQGDQISRRSVRFFLSSPYGHSFSSDGKRRFPTADELEPVMLFEPLESALERSWLLHAGDRIRRRIRRLAMAALLVVAIGPLLTWVASEWVRSGLDEYRTERSTGEYGWSDLEFRAQTLHWTPWALLATHVPTIRAWLPRTTRALAELDREVADAMQELDSEAARIAIRSHREWASKVAPDASRDLSLWKEQARDLSMFVRTGQPEVPDFDLGGLRVFREQLQAGSGVAGPLESEGVKRWERLLQQRSEKMSAAEATVAQEIRDRLRARVRSVGGGTVEDWLSQRDPAALSLLASHDGELLAKIDRDCGTFQSPDDLKTWPVPDRRKWQDQRIHELARERVQRWLVEQSTALDHEARLLSDTTSLSVTTAQRVTAIRDGLPAIPEWVWTDDWSGKAPDNSDLKSLVMLADALDLIKKLQSDDLMPVGEEIRWERLIRDFYATRPPTEILGQRFATDRISGYARKQLVKLALADGSDSLIRNLATVDPGVFGGELTKREHVKGAVRFGRGETWGQLLDRLETVEPGRLEAALQRLVGAEEVLNRLESLATAPNARLDRDRLQQLVAKSPQADQDFGKKVLPICLKTAWAKMRGGDKDSAMGWLRLGMTFGSAKKGYWCWAACGQDQVLSALRDIYVQAKSKRDLDASERQLMIAEDWLAMLDNARVAPPGGWPLNEDPAQIRAAISRHRKWIRDLDMVKIAAGKTPAGDMVEACWISSLECSRDDAARLFKFDPRLGPNEPDLDRPGVPKSAMGTDRILLFKQIQPKLVEGLRLPRRAELELANSRRPADLEWKTRLLKAIDTKPSEYVEPGSLARFDGRPADQTTEGLIGLAFGVKELCLASRGQSDEIGDENRPFSKWYGFRVATDEVPSILSRACSASLPKQVKDIP